MSGKVKRLNDQQKNCHVQSKLEVEAGEKNNKRRELSFTTCFGVNSVLLNREVLLIPFQIYSKITLK